MLPNQIEKSRVKIACWKIRNGFWHLFAGNWRLWSISEDQVLWNLSDWVVFRGHHNEQPCALEFHPPNFDVQVQEGQCNWISPPVRWRSQIKPIRANSMKIYWIHSRLSTQVDSSSSPPVQTNILPLHRLCDCNEAEHAGGSELGNDRGLAIFSPFRRASLFQLPWVYCLEITSPKQDTFVAYRMWWV